MSLSSPQIESESELDTLLNFVQKLSILLDKDKLKETVSLVSGLTASEKSSAEEARTNIAEYRQLVDDNNKKRAALDAFHESLMADKEHQDKDFADNNAFIESKKSEIQASLEAIAQRELQIKNDEEVNISADLKNKNDAIEISVARQDLEVISSNIQKDRVALDTKIAEVDAYEASLKTKASQLQKLTESI